jgi:hypothetical protein
MFDSCCMGTSCERFQISRERNPDTTIHFRTVHFRIDYHRGVAFGLPLEESLDGTFGWLARLFEGGE